MKILCLAALLTATACSSTGVAPFGVQVLTGHATTAPRVLPRLQAPVSGLQAQTYLPRPDSEILDQSTVPPQYLYGVSPGQNPGVVYKFGGYWYVPYGYSYPVYPIAPQN